MQTVMGLREAMEYLGKSDQVIRRLVRNGMLAASRDTRNCLLFDVTDLDRVRESKYQIGLTHTEIAARYGIKRGTVIYHLQRLEVKALGYNYSDNCNVYQESTIQKFAQILGWKEVALSQNPTDESSNHAHGVSEDA